RDLGDDGVSVGAQSSHSAGYPISQRECAGFNGAGFPVAALQPVGVTPKACRGTVSFLCFPSRRVMLADKSPVSLWSRVVGVAQPESQSGAACPSVSPKPLPFPVRS